jgi:tRNA(Ile)-lysidine synthase
LDSGPACWSLDFPNRIRIKRNGDILLFSKEKGAWREIDVNIGNGETVTFEYKMPKPTTRFSKEIGAHLKLSEIDVENLPDFSNIGHQVAFFDINALSFPLTLRNFRSGDRFNPLGMTGTQKVKKYFINKKVLKTQRERCPILLSRGKIVWVVGHRIDESAKVVPSTKKVLKGELLPFV